MPFHIYIRSGGDEAGYRFVFNQPEGWVIERLVEPWMQGSDIVVGGRHWHPKSVEVEIIETTQEIAFRDYKPRVAWNLAVESGHDKTDEFLNRPAGNGGSEDSIDFASDRRAVMVVHGRNEPIRRSMFDFLRSIGLQPLEWSSLIAKVNEGAPYIGQVLDAAFTAAQAVVVVSTPDDLAGLRSDLVPSGDPNDEEALQGQARPNVFFEAGMAMGRFPKRTILTECGQLRAASDLGGRHTIRLGSDPECRKELAERLKSAGCQVDTSGTDWLSAGDFEVSTPPFPPEGVDKAGDPTRLKLLKRINALLQDLPQSRYAWWGQAQIYNEIVDEANVDGIPVAEQMTPGAPNLSRMTAVEMRTYLNQLRVQLEH